MLSGETWGGENWAQPFEYRLVLPTVELAAIYLPPKEEGICPAPDLAIPALQSESVNILIVLPTYTRRKGCCFSLV